MARALREVCFTFLAKIFELVVVARNFLFDFSLRQSRPVGVPVISVGNLTVGGTGKTPLIHLLIRVLSGMGYRVGLISRGYGGEFTGIIRVETQNMGVAAQLYGDEPAMLALKNPKIPIFLGSSRVRAAEELLRACPVEVILADDGFQHRSLHRDLDIVLLDCMEPVDHYRLLPLGRAREPFAGIKRADVVVLSKSNLVSSSEVAALYEKIHALQLPKGPLVLKTNYGVRCAQNLVTGEVRNEFGAERVIAVCGIGRPKSFIGVLERDLKVRVVERFFFEDHHHYDDSEVRKVLERADELGVKTVLTTEKDAVKLLKFEAGIFWRVPLEVEMEDSEGDLKKLILEVMRAGAQ